MYNRKILISAVQNRPALWLHTDKDFKNRSKTSKEWEEVGKLCGINNGKFYTFQELLFINKNLCITFNIFSTISNNILTVKIDLCN